MYRWSEQISTSRSRHAADGRIEAGFTLLELLIVIVILGILASIVAFSLQGVTSSAATSACQSDFATSTEAVAAYQVQMGAYPAGTGSPMLTDSDPGTAPAFTLGAVPNGVNAARPGGELLVSGATAPNRKGTGNDGPWLKQSPASQGRYGIWVANDGSGTVQVLDGNGKVPAGATHTADDCAAVMSGGPTTTTTADVATTTTTTTTTPPTTTTTTTTPPTTTTTTTPPATTTTTRAPTRSAPRFTSASGTTFRLGAFGSFTVTASGSPAPSLSVSGRLPPGVSFDRGSGVLSGTPSMWGTYRVRFSATNGVRPNATQSFTLRVE